MPLPALRPFLAALLFGALAACSTSPPVRSPPAPSTPAPPAAAAFIGKVKKVSPGDGSSADVVLNKVRYVRLPGQSMDTAIFDVTITGTSSRPFRYSEAAFVFGYADDTDPYSHNQDSNLYGPRGNDDYSAYVPPPRLGSGELERGRQRHGLVILHISSKSAYDLLLTPLGSANALAEWALTSG